MFQHGLQLTFKHMRSVFRSSQQSALISSFCFQVFFFFLSGPPPFIDEASFGLLQHLAGPAEKLWEHATSWFTMESKARLAVAREESGPGRNLPGNLPSRLACSFVPLFRLYLGPLPLGVEVGRQFHLPLPLISLHLMPGIRPEALVKRQISWNRR